MKKFLIPFFLFSVVFLISAAPPILRQFGTTNTPTVLTNIIQSLAGGGSQVWTNDGTAIRLLNGFNTYIATNTSGGAGLSTIVHGATTPTGHSWNDAAQSISSVHNTALGEPERNYFEMASVASGNSDANLGYCYIRTDSNNGPGGLSMIHIRSHLPDANSSDEWNIISECDRYSDLFFVSYLPNAIDSYPLFMKPNLYGDNTSAYKFGTSCAITNGDLVRFTNAGTNIASVGILGAITGKSYTVSGTTNQVIFGATNTAPSSAVAPTKWISVQVQGETAVYRLPLYE